MGSPNRTSVLLLPIVCEMYVGRLCELLAGSSGPKTTFGPASGTRAPEVYQRAIVKNRTEKSLRFLQTASKKQASRIGSCEVSMADHPSLKMHSELGLVASACRCQPVIQMQAAARWW